MLTQLGWVTGATSSSVTNITINWGFTLPDDFRIFVIIQHGADVSNLTGGIAEWDFEGYSEVDEPTPQTRGVSIYSRLVGDFGSSPTSITVTQASAARLCAVVCAGPYESIGSPVTESYPSTSAPFPCAVPAIAAEADKDTIALAGFVVTQSAAGHSWDDSVFHQPLLSYTGRNNRIYAVQSLIPAGDTQSAGTVYSSVGGGIQNGAGLFLRLVSLYEPEDLFITKAMPLVVPSRSDALRVAKGVSYVAMPKGKGLFVAKAQAYTFPPIDPLDQQYIEKAVAYAVRQTPNDALILKKGVIYVVSGMAGDLQPQEITKAVAYVVRSYDKSGDIYQDDPELGPVPARWRLDEDYPYVEINDGTFHFFPYVPGDYTAFLMNMDGTISIQSFTATLNQKIQLQLTSSFNQIAILQLPYSVALANSLRKAMLARRVPSSSF